jgi:magnesium transporter
MITAYVYENRRLTVTELNIQDSIPTSTIWLDLYTCKN